MADFFTERVAGYEDHMLKNVEGCREGYIEIAKLIPENCNTLLDLGCGTGLELKEIFRKIPDLNVTGIDLTASMLKKCKENYPNRGLTLIYGNYFDIDLGIKRFDAAISCQTMHHFTHEQKISLYKRIHAALKPNGMYVECDYIVQDQNEEDFYFSEFIKMRKEQGIDKRECVHYDTPCTIENQLKMFNLAGFRESKKVWQMGNTVIIVCK